MTQAPVYDDRELDRTPPQDLAAEQSVLGAMMMSNIPCGAGSATA